MKPAFKPQTHEKYNRLIEAAVAAGPVVTAVAHPCDEASLKGAIEAARLGLITPVLIGPPRADQGCRGSARNRHRRLPNRGLAAQP